MDSESPDAARATSFMLTQTYNYRFILKAPGRRVLEDCPRGPWGGRAPEQVLTAYLDGVGARPC